MTEDAVPGPDPAAAAVAAAYDHLSDASHDGFTPFDRALDGLSGEVAVRKPAGSPYSPAEVLAHMLFWQQRHLAILDGAPPVPVATAAVGWPSASAADWDGMVEKYQAGLARYRAVVAEPAAVTRPVREGSSVSAATSTMSMFIHDAHHLGQIILLRRMLGAWPPPGGGDTW